MTTQTKEELREMLACYDMSSYAKDSVVNLIISLFDSHDKEMKEKIEALKPGYIQSWHDTKLDRAELDGYNNAIGDITKLLSHE